MSMRNKYLAIIVISNLFVQLLRVTHKYLVSYVPSDARDPIRKSMIP